MNNPIRFIDPDGRGVDDIILTYRKDGKDYSMKYTIGMKDDENYAEEFRHAIQGLNWIHSKEPAEIEALSKSTYYDSYIDVSMNSVTASTNRLEMNIYPVKNRNGKYSSQTIYEPFGGYVDENNNKHAPIGGLYHELLHSYDRMLEVKVFHDATSKKSMDLAKSWFLKKFDWNYSGSGIHGFDTNDEIGPTKKEAIFQEKYLNEKPRPNHRGIVYFAKWPFSTESKDGKYPKFEESEQKK
jgi:hypothetical protein